MRITVFVSYLPPHIGGIETVADGEIRTLALQGHDVSVITSACGSRPGLYTYRGYRLRRIPAWNYFERKIGSPFPIYSATLLWHAFKAVRRAEVVHIHDAFYLTSVVGAAWAKILRKPLILTQHVDLVPHPLHLVRFAQRLVYATAGRFVLLSCNNIIILNSRVKSFVKSKGALAERIVFLANGIDTRVFAPPEEIQKRTLRKRYHLPEDGMLALFVGRLVPKKGAIRLLNVKLPPNIQLVFVGSNPPSGHNGTQHHFLGPIDHNHIDEVFKACDMFVLPSQGEGFPVAAQEAMATGLPIIMTDDPAYDLYQLDRSGVRLIGSDLSAVEESIRAVAKDSELRNAMAHYSHTYALEHFTLTTHIYELLAIYRSSNLRNLK